MFPFIRMNQIYGNMGPDFNAGLDDPLIQQVVNRRNANPPLTPALPRIQQLATNPNIGHPGGSQGNPQDRDVVLGPHALDQAHIGIDPDKGDLLDPKTKAQLALKQDQFNQSLGFKQDQLGSLDEYRHGQLSNTEESNRIRANRADIYRYKALNPDLKFMISRGGTIHGFNPRTGESFDTGVDSGTLSDQDKLELLGTQHMEEIGARGDISRDLLNTRGQQSLEQIAARTAGTKEINAAKPEKTEPANQTKVRQNITAHELVNKHPELARYITFNGDGTFSVSKNADEITKKQINDVVYGTKPTTSKSSTTSKSTGGDRITVTKDGKQFSLPKSQLQDAIKQGYKQVGG